jgi:hypothetical protein
MPKLESGKFVHVVGSIDLAVGTGKILYVNPSTVSTKPTVEESAPAAGAGPAPSAEFELVVEDANGAELKRIRPAILLPTDSETTPTTALIDENIPFIDGMKRLVLVHHGAQVDAYEAGEPIPAGAGPVSDMNLGMGAAPPGHPEKRDITFDGIGGPEPGVSYTVQVKPAGHSAWQTIAVGRSMPAFQLDRNQFPGADRASVRVLRTTGFEDQVIAEDEVDLGFDE